MISYSSNLLLLLVQSSCFCITLVLAIVLLMARFHLRTVSRSYETSRWLLTTALLLYAVHYALQMIFGFRAQGEDVGALVNILFYLPIAFLLVCATLRISAGWRYLRRFGYVGVTGIVVNTVIFGAGLAFYGNLHMPLALHAMEVVYVGMIAFFIFSPGGELQRIYRKIEDETADDNTKYHLYMRSGTVLLYAMGLVGAMSIFSTQMVVGVAAFFLLALIFYVVSFVSLGFGIQELSEIVEEGSAEALGSPASTEQGDEDLPHDSAACMGEQRAQGQDSPAQIVGQDDLSLRPSSQPAEAADSAAQIEADIAAWRAGRGYSVPSLTSITMAQRLGIPKRQLTQYLAEHEGVTFRVWLSNIRIEEAKRMLLTETHYSIEAIAEACGFSSRSWMQEKFKASTGMTPAEWRATQKP